VDDPLLVRMLDRLTDLHEQHQPVPDGQPPLGGVGRDRPAVHQFHHEEGAAGGRPAGVEHPGDVRVVHQRQRPPLRLEPVQHLPGVHAGLDHLQGHGPADRLVLLGGPDGPHPALAEQAAERVRPDPGVGVGAGAAFAPGFRRRAGRRAVVGRAVAGAAEEAARLDQRGEQLVDPPADPSVAPAGVVKERPPFGDGELQCAPEQCLDPFGIGGHRLPQT
jgi:hypothetical protein